MYRSRPGGEADEYGGERLRVVSDQKVAYHIERGCRSMNFHSLKRQP